MTVSLVRNGYVDPNGVFRPQSRDEIANPFRVHLIRPIFRFDT